MRAPTVLPDRARRCLAGRSIACARGTADGDGAGGEVRIEDPRIRPDILDARPEAAAECPVPPVKTFNAGDNFGCAYFQMNPRRGQRCSARISACRPGRVFRRCACRTGKPSPSSLPREGQPLYAQSPRRRAILKPTGRSPI